MKCLGFPGSSVGKESTCNAGDPSSIPGSGRSPGEGVGYLLQYSWASLVAQLVMNLPDNAGDPRDTGLIPGCRRSAAEGNGNPLQYSCLEIFMDRAAWWATVHGVAKSQTPLCAHKGTNIDLFLLFVLVAQLCPTLL